VIIDAHQHFWNLERVSYPWLTDELAPIHRTIEEPELEPQLVAAGIDRTVLVQSMDSIEDSDFMLAVADRWPRVGAVVGWVPLTAPDEAARELDRRAADARFVGVRHLIHNEPDEDWLLRPEVHDGLALLAERGLSFDVVAVTPRHLEHVPVIAEQHPALQIVIDHLAKPPIAARAWQPWATLLGRAAEHPNVHAKISGLNTAAAPDWTAKDLQPYVDHAVAVFGSNRLMYGGDWPISTLAGDYAGVWSATQELLAGLERTDRDRILGGTAQTVYKVPT
jgi:L-fuconolactonase